MDEVVREERNTKLINHFVEWKIVELVKKMWHKCLLPNVLEQNNEELPQHILASLSVLRLSYFPHYYFVF